MSISRYRYDDIRDTQGYLALLANGRDRWRQMMQRYPMYLDYRGRRWVYFTMDDVEEHIEQLRDQVAEKLQKHASSANASDHR